MDLTSGPAPQLGNIWKANSNVVPPDLVALLGSTAAGRAAAFKALHPASETVSAQQWPDHNTENTVVFQNTDVFDIPPPSDVKTSWSVIIVLTAFPDARAWIVRFTDTPKTPNEPQGDSTSQGTWDTNFTAIYSKPWFYKADAGVYPGDDYTGIRVTAASGTFDLNASALNDAGTVFAGQFRADVDNRAQKPPSKEEIMEMVMAKLKELELVKDPPNDAEDQVDAGPPVSETGEAIVYQDLPDTPTGIMQGDPKAYMAKAKEGVYIPLRHSQPNLPFRDCSIALKATPRNPNTDSGIYWPAVTLANEFNWGIVYFSGISKDASVTGKLITCLEGMPRATSNLAKLVQPAPRLDQRAIDQVQEAMCKLPHAFPSSYNALGTIIHSILSALNKGTSWLLGANKSLGGAPQKFLDSLF